MKSNIMNKPSMVTTIAGLVRLAAAGAGQADENPAVLARLIESGELLSWKAAGKKAKELRPGARVSQTDLDREWNRYVYKREVVDANGVEWDIDLDAKTGEVLMQERQD
ncbi:MAG: PepSY domain-containing protein [Pseudomonadota bacterium]|nr:PepSY domain-containing protein [Pseudomonadota bacterium]